eukprot:14078437-Alexandrium_andersonii.AAC.1
MPTGFRHRRRSPRRGHLLGRGPVSGTSSGAATPTGLRRMIDEEFDPTKKSREAWQARMVRVSVQLERAGQ